MWTTRLILSLTLRSTLKFTKIFRKVPWNAKEALAADCWKNAMKDELKSLSENMVWTLVPATKNQKVFVGILLSNVMQVEKLLDI